MPDTPLDPRIAPARALYVRLYNLWVSEGVLLQDLEQGALAPEGLAAAHQAIRRDLDEVKRLLAQVTFA